jgi:hypothetical protein
VLLWMFAPKSTQGAPASNVTAAAPPQLLDA